MYKGISSSSIYIIYIRSLDEIINLYQVDNMMSGQSRMAQNSLDWFIWVNLLKKTPIRPFDKIYENK